MYLVKLKRGDNGPWLAFTHAGPIWVTDKAFAKTYPDSWTAAMAACDIINNGGPYCWTDPLETNANSNPNKPRTTKDSR